LLIEKFAFAVETLCHRFVAVQLSGTGIEGFHFIIAPLGFTLNKCLILYAELWWFASVAFLLVFSVLIIDKFFGALRIVDLQAERPKSLPAYTT
jgi:hypothetical protein